MRDVFNFNAGPAMLPEEVLLKAQAELLNWHDTGMSFMEIGHRTDEFKSMADLAESDLRYLMHIPDHYRILFLAGGASTQFAMVPMNLMNDQAQADYIDTGVWSKKAILEAKRYGAINIAAETESQDGLHHIPHQDKWQLNPDASYVHYTPNETIDGIQFHWVPKTGEVPLVADMTSMILSQPIDVTQYGLIYAGAQKNIGPAGLTIVIIREDLIKEPIPVTPSLFTYKIHAENHSVYNTPPTFCWYMASLLFSYMRENGGVEHFYETNKRKAKKIYDCIDAHPDFYHCKISKDSRSIMNVMFYLKDEQLTSVFLEKASEIGLINLRGHRVSGGVRASIYNAMPEEGVDRLVNFMIDFASRHSVFHRVQSQA